MYAEPSKKPSYLRRRKEEIIKKQEDIADLFE